MLIRRKELIRFLKFSLVGVAGAVVDFGSLYVLHPVLGLNIVLANTCSFSAAVLNNYVLNRYWTYPESRSKSVRAQVLQFFAVSVVGWALNTGMLVGLRFPMTGLVQMAQPVFSPLGDPEIAYRVGYNLAKALATAVVLFWNFFVNRYWTFSDVDDAEGGAGAEG